MDANRGKIRRFTSNKFSLNDYLFVSSCFKKEEFDGGLKQYMEKDWNETENGSSNQERLNRILDRLHQKININKGNSSFRFYNLFSKVAVVLLIPALISIAVLSYFSISSPNGLDAWAEIYSPAGTRTKFQLPDGTEGWLNSGSSIKYPVRFKDRHVEVSGEAWFDVVPRKSDVFRVITPYFDVNVLGTRFNVVAYGNEATDEVILEKGKVLIQGKGQGERTELRPDQRFIYDKAAGKSVRTSIDSKTYTRWKDGVLIFKNEPMTEIAKRLERRYQVEIVLHGHSLESSIFRATFQDESLEEICRMLSAVAPIQYRIHKREMQPDNTFSASKVEMWLKDESQFN